jgi:predicted nucleic acid-binding protein
MSHYLDSSILVASLLPADPDYAACEQLLAQPGGLTLAHSFNETFATLTGGRLGIRIDQDTAAAMIRESILPSVQLVDATGPMILDAHSQARSRGARGGAIYDFMHLLAAARTGAAALYTLNTSDFLALHKAGDPPILHPAKS